MSAAGQAWLWSTDTRMTDKKEPSTSDKSDTSALGTPKHGTVTPETGKSAEAAAAKRPHATLDLKAIEVKGTTVTAPSSVSASSSEKAAADQPGPSKASDAKPGPAKPAAPVATAKPTSRLFAHLLSGVAGGLLALFGADQVAPMLGLRTPGVAMQDKALELQNRLLALEAAAKAAAAKGNAADQIAVLTDKLESIDVTAAAVKALETAQAALAADTKAATADIAKRSNVTNAGDRLEKLEQRLAILAAAAGTDADKGRIQGLAAVTGKVSDLESGFNTKLNEVRKGLIIELEARLAAASEASEKARTGTERLDRELASLKTDAARLGQNLEVQKSEGERIAATVQVVQQESAKLTSSLNGLKSAVDTQLSTVLRPADVAQAVSPVTDKLTLLENSLAAVVKSEDERKVSAERIVVTLELANLKRALERGQGYANELAEVRKAAAGKVDLAVLDRYQASGVKTLPDLQRELGPMITAAIDADTVIMEGSVMDRLLAGAKSAVRVRKTNHAPGDKSAEAVMARIETAVKDGQLGDVLTLAKDLPSRAAVPVQDWLANVEARHAVDDAIAAVEKALKATLTGKSAVVAPPAASGDTATLSTNSRF